MGQSFIKLLFFCMLTVFGMLIITDMYMNECFVVKLPLDAVNGSTFRQQRMESIRNYTGRRMLGNVIDDFLFTDRKILRYTKTVTNPVITNVTKAGDTHENQRVANNKSENKTSNVIITIDVTQNSDTAEGKRANGAWTTSRITDSKALDIFRSIPNKKSKIIENGGNRSMEVTDNSDIVEEKLQQDSVTDGMGKNTTPTEITLNEPHGTLPHSSQNQSITKWMVNTQKCKIPDIDPFDSILSKMVHNKSLSNPKLKCSNTSELTFQEDYMLKINKSVVERHYRYFNNCCYHPFRREGSDDEKLIFDKHKTACFEDEMFIKDSFIKVECFNTTNHKIYSNYYAFMQKRVNKEKNTSFEKHVKDHKLVEKLNVVFIGLDSVSRLNFMRNLPKTRNYLMENMEAIELQGYTKVRDNTRINIIPMLTGKFLEELDGYGNKFFSVPLDNQPLIWKEFSKRGYSTMFAEDYPGIAIFNYLSFGFKEQPTDYYYRPFAIGLEKDRAIWKASEHPADRFCIGHRQETSVILDYVYDFINEHQYEPHFGFTFITRATHASLNHAAIVDEPHFHFLQKLDSNNLLNNTVLVYLSDHGMRYGPILQTWIGKIEERMPLMYLVFPKWFYKKYPKISENLKINSHRLTTPFDMHETLLDIMDFKGKTHRGNISERGISMFKEIPEERSCDDADIPQHWCACEMASHIDPKTPDVQEAAKAAIKLINSLLASHRNICIELTLRVVQDASKSVSTDAQYNTIAKYLLTFVTDPSGGQFETTVTYTNGTFNVEQDISRISLYGKQSHCVPVHELKKFCYCTDIHKQTLKTQEKRQKLREKIMKARKKMNKS